MKRSDNFLCSFPYIIESADLEPRLSNVLDGLKESSKKGKVIFTDISSFKFSDDDYQVLIRLANELRINDKDLFISRLRQFIKLNLHAKSIDNDGVRRSELQRELNKFKGAAKKLNDIFLSLSDESSRNVLNLVNGGAEDILGSDQHLDSNYICRLLTLFEHADLCIDQEHYSHIHTPLDLVKRLHSFWLIWLTPEVAAQRGTKARFETLLEIVLRNTNQPKSDPRYWIKKLNLR